MAQAMSGVLGAVAELRGVKSAVGQELKAFEDEMRLPLKEMASRGQAEDVPPTIPAPPPEFMEGADEQAPGFGAPDGAASGAESGENPPLPAMSPVPPTGAEEGTAPTSIAPPNVIPASSSLTNAPSVADLTPEQLDQLAGASSGPGAPPGLRSPQGPGAPPGLRSPPGLGMPPGPGAPPEPGVGTSPGAGAPSESGLPQWPGMPLGPGAPPESGTPPGPGAPPGSQSQRTGAPIAQEEEHHGFLDRFKRKKHDLNI